VGAAEHCFSHAEFPRLFTFCHRDEMCRVTDVVSETSTTKGRNKRLGRSRAAPPRRQAAARKHVPRGTLISVPLRTCHRCRVGFGLLVRAVPGPRVCPSLLSAGLCALPCGRLP
jgi:hypothetical protein